MAKKIDIAGELNAVTTESIVADAKQVRYNAMDNTLANYLDKNRVATSVFSRNEASNRDKLIAFFKDIRIFGTNVPDLSVWSISRNDDGIWRIYLVYYNQDESSGYFATYNSNSEEDLCRFKSRSGDVVIEMAVDWSVIENGDSIGDDNRLNLISKKCVYAYEKEIIDKVNAVSEDVESIKNQQYVTEKIGKSTNVAMSQNAVSSYAGFADYPEFSETYPYPKGSVVQYDGALYKFIVDHSRGAWNEEEVSLFSLKSEMDELGIFDVLRIIDKTIRERYRNLFKSLKIYNLPANKRISVATVNVSSHFIDFIDFDSESNDIIYRLRSNGLSNGIETFKFSDGVIFEAFINWGNYTDNFGDSGRNNRISLACYNDVLLTKPEYALGNLANMKAYGNVVNVNPPTDESVRGYLTEDGAVLDSGAYIHFEITVKAGERFRIIGTRQVDGTAANSVVYNLYSSDTQFDSTTLVKTGPIMLETYDYVFEIPTDAVTLLVSMYKKYAMYVNVYRIIQGKTAQDMALSDDILRIREFTRENKNLFGFKAMNLSEIEDDTFIGKDTALYMLSVPMGNRFNIRFKFKIVEDLLRNGKTADVFAIQSGDATSQLKITATPVTLTQQTETVQTDSTEITTYWPQLVGGIKFTEDYPFSTLDSQPANMRINLENNIGGFAFSIRYSGSLDELAGIVSVSCNGQQLVINEAGTVHTFVFSEYADMLALYKAIEQLENFELDYDELVGHTPYELPLFNAVRLVSDYYRVTEKDGAPHLFTDAAPLYIPYAVCDRWHQAEIFVSEWTSVDVETFVFVDGFYCARNNNFKWNTAAPTFIFGSHPIGGSLGFKVRFKDIEIDRNTPRDAELFRLNSVRNGFVVVSSVNPAITILEGHNMTEKPGLEASDDSDISTNPDVLQRVFSYMQEKGYVPVTMDDICDFYAMNKDLPKRCYTIIFDDWVWDNFLNLKKRSVFTRNAVRAYIATWANINYSIKFNNEDITMDEALRIAQSAGFGVLSHTRDHHNVLKIKPSLYIDEWNKDVYAADKKGINPNILIYPGGNENSYYMSMLRHVGANLGITVSRPYKNMRCTNRYALSRVNIQQGSDLEKDILSNIV